MVLNCNTVFALCVVKDTSHRQCRVMVIHNPLNDDNDNNDKSCANQVICKGTQNRKNQFSLEFDCNN
jgi:hypothetical protein